MSNENDVVCRRTVDLSGARENVTKSIQGFHKMIKGMTKRG